MYPLWILVLLFHVEGEIKILVPALKEAVLHVKDVQVPEPIFPLSITFPNDKYLDKSQSTGGKSFFYSAWTMWSGYDINGTNRTFSFSTDKGTIETFSFSTSSDFEQTFTVSKGDTIDVDLIYCANRHYPGKVFIEDNKVKFIVLPLPQSEYSNNFILYTIMLKEIKLTSGKIYNTFVFE